MSEFHSAESILPVPGSFPLLHETESNQGDSPPISLACSGGGIRSASFCSGVLKELLKHEKEFKTIIDSRTDVSQISPEAEEKKGTPSISLEEISSVSGGGYLASSFIEFLHSTYPTAKELGQKRKLVASYFDRFRTNIGYLFDCRFLSFDKRYCFPNARTLGWSFLKGIESILAFVMVLSIWAVSTLILMVPPMFPLVKMMQWIDPRTSEQLKAICDLHKPSPWAIEDYWYTWRYCTNYRESFIAAGFAAVVFLAIVMPIIARAWNFCMGCCSISNRFISVIDNLAKGLMLVGSGYLMIVLGSVVEREAAKQPALGIGLLFGIPTSAALAQFIIMKSSSWAAKSGGKTFEVVAIYTLYVIVFNWFIKESNVVLGIIYINADRELVYNIMLALLILQPFAYLIKHNIIHLYYRWRLEKAFYSYNFCRLFTVIFSSLYGGSCRNAEVTFGSLGDSKPRYIANTTANLWKVEKKKGSRSTTSRHFDIVSIETSKTANKTLFKRYSHFESNEIREDDIEEYEGIDIPIGEAMALSGAAASHHAGATSMLSPIRFLGLVLNKFPFSLCQEGRNLPQLFTLLMYHLLVIAACIVELVPSRPSYLRGDVALVLLTIGSFLGSILLDFSNLMSGSLEYIPIVRFLRVILSINTFSNNNFAVEPSLSDGGHLENTGAYYFLQQKRKFIIIADGEEDPNEEFGALRSLVDVARKNLNCSFNFYPSQLSVESDSTSITVESHDAVANQDWEHGLLRQLRDVKTTNHFLFTVRYNEPSPTAETSHGYILYLKPRYHTTNKMKERLCCVARDCFPHHSTGYQFFTPAWYDAYHEEGSNALRYGIQALFAATTQQKLHVLPLSN